MNINFFAASILLGLLITIGCQTKKEQQFNPELKKEFLSMEKSDQEIRSYISEKYPDGRIKDEADIARWDSIDASNTSRLKLIIKGYGWPGYSLVGEEGSAAAFLIIQHADKDPEFQQKVLLLLEEAVQNDEAKPSHLAYLTDRVRVKQGKPQVYGTQMNFVHGKLVPHTIEDSSNVDKRRLEVGLDSLSKYLNRFKN